MRKIFQVWLLCCMLAAFTVSFGTIYWYQTHQAERNAARLIDIKLRDTLEQLSTNTTNAIGLYSMADRNAMAKTRAFAQMLVLEPSLAADYKRLRAVRDLLDVDELHVCDAKGIIVASSQADLVGYDLNLAEQSRAFIPAITDKDFTLVQPPMPRGAGGRFYQYAGVSRLDAPGIVQIGYYPERLQTVLAASAVGNLSSGLRIGSGGSIVIFKDGIVVGSALSEWLGKDLEYFGVEMLPSQEGNLPARLQGVAGAMLSRGASFGEYTVLGFFPEKEAFAERNATAVYTVLGNLILFGVIFILISRLVERTVIRGVYAINDSVKRITEGDLLEQVEVTGNPEFASLSGGINSMVAALRQAALEAKQRMDRELVLAKAIQLGSLPNILTTLPYRNEFDIFAVMFTAKEVGGDFYDFFIIDQEHLGFLIADVSDKGIPAALFMMTAKAHLKNLMLTEKDLGKAVSAANNLLCQDNQADMFVTCFAAVLNFKTGEIVFTNAGHNPPYLFTPGEGYVPLKGKRYFVLGGMEDIPYGVSTVRLKPGSRLLLYTDGVTEAVNPALELFGEDRLAALLNAPDSGTSSLKQLLTVVKEDVDNFMDGAEQADDITMLALEYRGG